jgi:hypothetical protein
MAGWHTIFRFPRLCCYVRSALSLVCFTFISGSKTYSARASAKGQITRWPTPRFKLLDTPFGRVHHSRFYFLFIFFILCIPFILFRNFVPWFLEHTTDVHFISDFELLPIVRIFLSKFMRYCLFLQSVIRCR